MLVLGTSVVILVRQNITPQMQIIIDTALSKGMEIITMFVGRCATGTAAAGAAAGNLASDVVLGAPFVGAFGGFVIGWEAAEHADSMIDAMKSAIDSNFELAKHVIENVHQFSAVAFKANKMKNEYKSK